MVSMRDWTLKDIPDQTGRVALITGANSGLGYESTLALARHHARVVLTARSQTKGEAARDAILRQVPGAVVDLMLLDLASQESIRQFAEEFKLRYERLDMLINNAGVMAPPRQETVDGFEMQFGVNHLGHFALTGLLLELLLSTSGSRVVTVSSGAQFMGRVDLDDLQSKHGYTPYGAYSQSKLANVLFAFELQRRLKAAGADTISVAVHPGYAGTNLQQSSASANNSRLQAWLYRIGNALFSQTQAQGARPQLYAATMPDVKGGDHIAVGFMHLRGPVARVRAARPAYNQDTAWRLWEASEALTGVRYSALARTKTQPKAASSAATSPASV